MKTHLVNLKEIVGRYLKNIGGNNFTYITGGVIANYRSPISFAHRMFKAPLCIKGEFDDVTPKVMREYSENLSIIIKEYLVANGLIECYFEHRLDEMTKIATMNIIIVENAIWENCFSW